MDNVTLAFYLNTEETFKISLVGAYTEPMVARRAIMRDKVFGVIEWYREGAEERPSELEGLIQKAIGVYDFTIVLYGIRKPARTSAIVYGYYFIGECVIQGDRFDHQG